MVDKSRHPLLNVGWLKNPILQDRHAQLYVLLTLLGVATSALFPGGWPVALAFYAFGAARIWHRGLRKMVWMVAMSPLVQVPLASFMVGVAGYATGTAVIFGGHVPGGVAHVDPATRARVVRMGCMRDGSEVFTMLPNNAAVAGLTAVFGPMKGAYDGPFPDAAQSRSLILEQGVQVDAWDVEKGELQLAGETVHFPPVAVASGDAIGFHHARTFVARPANGLLLVAQVEGDVLSIHAMDLTGHRELALWRTLLLPQDAQSLETWPPSRP